MSLRNPKVISEIKVGFLTLCQQYDMLGQFLRTHAEVVKEKMGGTKAGLALKLSLDQFHEIGEQLKVVGRAVDLLEG